MRAVIVLFCMVASCIAGAQTFEEAAAAAKSNFSSSFGNSYAPAPAQAPAAPAASAPVAKTFGIPEIVFDPANFGENSVTSVQQVAQVLKQIEEYRLQIQQYADQVVNVTDAPLRVWDDVSGIVDGALDAIDTLDYYREQAGSLEAYIENFKDIDSYRDAACWLTDACRFEQRRIFELMSRAKRNAAGRRMKGLEKQQDQMTKDSRQIARIQRAVNASEGRQATLKYQGQLLSQIAQQLLQLRTLEVSQQSEAAASASAEMDQEAARRVLMEQINYVPPFVRSDEVCFSLAGQAVPCG